MRHNHRSLIELVQPEIRQSQQPNRHGSPHDSTDRISAGAIAAPSRRQSVVGWIVVGGLTLLFAFTALYVAAFSTPRAKGIDVGVAGTPAQAARLQVAL